VAGGLGQRESAPCGVGMTWQGVKTAFERVRWRPPRRWTPSCGGGMGSHRVRMRSCGRGTHSHGGEMRSRSGGMRSHDAGMRSHNAGTRSHDAGTRSHNGGMGSHDAGARSHDGGIGSVGRGNPCGCPDVCRKMRLPICIRDGHGFWDRGKPCPYRDAMCCMVGATLAVTRMFAAKCGCRFAFATDMGFGMGQALPLRQMHTKHLWHWHYRDGKK